MNATGIAKAIGHAIFKHDLNITDDLFIIHANELDTLCEDATREITENQSLTVNHTDKPTDAEIEAAAFGIFEENVNMAKLNPTENDYREAFEQTPDMLRDQYRRQGYSALLAARKAVTQ